MVDDLIEVRHLSAHYDGQLVLEDISFSVQQGELFYIIGGSGSGKTTLFKHMVGLLKPTSGEILYSGVDITRLDEDELAAVQRKIGIAFQSGALFNSLTVGDNVALPLREVGSIDINLIEAIVRLKLSLVGLAGTEHMLPAELSGGMMKRASLARALALDPPVVFFDEPSAGLDPITAAGLDRLVLTLRNLTGTTFVIVSHELRSILGAADRVLMLDCGKGIFLGSVGEAQRSSVPRVRQFFERRANPVNQVQPCSPL